ncbi:hypothetical protein SHPE106448_07270 [Shewanella pealeana]
MKPFRFFLNGFVYFSLRMISLVIVFVVFKFSLFLISYYATK